MEFGILVFVGGLHRYHYWRLQVPFRPLIRSDIELEYSFSTPPKSRLMDDAH